jgi:hypothetical protein
MISESCTYHKSPIWCYGNIEFHFCSEAETEVLWLIHFDRFDVDGIPTGGQSINIEPWIIRRGKSRKEIEEELIRCEINYSDSTWSIDQETGTTRLSSGVGVELLFADDEYSVGLCGVSYHERKHVSFTNMGL